MSDGSRRLRVLAISGRLPLPSTDGDRIANFGLLRALASEHDVTLVSILAADDNLKISGYNNLFNPDQVSLVALSAAPELSRTRRAALRRLTVGLFTGMPPRYQSHCHPTLCDKVRVMSKNSDIVVFLDNMFAQYVHCSTAPVILHMHNVDGWSAATYKPVGISSYLLKKSSLRQIRNVEGRAVRAAQAVTVTSKEEAKRLVDLYGLNPFAVVPSGVDIPDIVPRNAGSPVVAWLGNHSYGPNSDGLRRFIEESWPLVHEISSAELWIAGADPPQSIQSLEGTEGIKVLGYVEDLTDFFSSVSVGVVPLWAGAGVKLKTITMLSNGIPTVSTTVGAEGIDHERSRALVVVDDPREISRSIVQLLKDRELAETMGERGRDLVRSKFSWRVTGAILNATISEVYSSLSDNA